jgi:diguanylate cyclase (GGDEF)-like protein
VTRPDLPAVRTGGRVSVPSWVEDSEFDRDTEISDLLEPATLSSTKHRAKDQSLLVRLDGVDAGQVSSLDGIPLSIGRHPTNRLRISDVGISRFHARVYQEAGETWVEDLDSQNGTFLMRDGAPDKQKLTGPTKLQNGDVLSLGRRVGLRYGRVDAEQAALMRQLFESSTRDALTGAYNRKHFDDRLRTELAYALRHNTSVALIMVDIDHFKKVNDRHGHAVGDLVLRQTARAVSQRLRTEDMFARFGGEEFAVILRGVNLSGAARLGERLRATVAALPTQSEGTPIPVTISLGCATLSCCELKTEAALLAAADRRLYRAKHQGRNRVVSEG